MVVLEYAPTNPISVISVCVLFDANKSTLSLTVNVLVLTDVNWPLTDKLP